MRYLLDTNIVSDLIRFPQGRCAARIAAVGQGNVCTSIVVACELRYGAAKRRSVRLSRQVEAVLGAIEIAPFEAPADKAYGTTRTKLESAGTPIGGNDLLIAAQALSLSLVLVTDNEREFSRVQGLKIENWIR
jgi:tRNA(fMet)-specific endonuclease VapC